MNTTAYDKAKSTLGIFDASETYGRVIAKGKDVLDLLHRMSTNDLRPMFDKPGSGAQTILTTDKGRIIDLLSVINRGKDSLLVTSMGKEEMIIQWLDKFTIMEDAKFLSATNGIRQFILVGPRSLDLVRSLLSGDLVSMEQFDSILATINGHPVLIQKSLRIIESGWTVFVEVEFADDVKANLEARAEEMGGAVIDQEIFEVLRIEVGLPIAPNELNEKHNPLEASIVGAVSFTKGCYIGQEVIARLDSYDKVQRHLMGIRMSGSEAKADSLLQEKSKFPFKLKSKSGEDIGEVTSLVYSPDASSIIGLAYVRTAHTNPGEVVGVAIGEESLVDASLEKVPFELELASR
jgi:folate-binding protein YgfZ